jgi:signal transduction histidine kinase
MARADNMHRKSITDYEIASLRQSLGLLQSQINSERVEVDFLTRQLERMTNLLDRYENERHQSQQTAQFEALYTVSRVLGSSLDLQTVLDQVMDAIIQLTGAERGFLMLQDDDGQLKVKAARNFDQQTLSSDEFNYSRTVANQVLDSGAPILTTNAAEDPRFSGQASIVAQSLRSIMAAPLRARGTVIGVAYVDSRAMGGLFTQDNLTALEAFSGQAAVALDNAMLFNATDKALSARVEQLRQLRRIDLLLNETLDAENAMAYTLEWACRLSSAQAGHLALVEAPSEGIPPKIDKIHHYGPHENDLPLESAHPEILDVLNSGQTTAYTDHEGMRTLLMVPVRREQIIVGVMVLEKDPGTDFSSEEQDLVERIVSRAAITIENARLYAAVRAADKAKSEFVGIVAHDLKAPMNSIGGYASLLLMQGDLSDRQTDYANKIKDTVHRMEILVSDLADISRIESGHFFMEEEPTAVADVIQAVKDTAMPQIAARNHRFVEDVEQDLPQMYIDYYRLLQVLTNLVSNAYKYTPDGGIITLGAHRDGGRIRFSVRDTGVGLSEENIARLGTKFWRAEDRFTRSQPGTGLGFAITRSLVEQMGSEIDIQSALGEGSTFSFSVPFAQQTT